VKPRISILRAGEQPAGAAATAPPPTPDDNAAAFAGEGHMAVLSWPLLQQTIALLRTGRLDASLMPSPVDAKAQQRKEMAAALDAAFAKVGAAPNDARERSGDADDGLMDSGIAFKGDDRVSTSGGVAEAGARGPLSTQVRPHHFAPHAASPPRAATGRASSPAPRAGAPGGVRACVVGSLSR